MSILFRFNGKGKLHQLEKENRVIQIDYQKNKKIGDEIIFDTVHAYNGQFGRPYLNDVRVIGQVLKHGKNKKIVNLRYKAKKRYKKKQGHRQLYTKVKITSIIDNASGEKRSKSSSRI